MVTASGATPAAVTAPRTARRSLDRVVDPEIPALTIADLGVLRDVRQDPGGHVEVTITPTYSGCPMMAVITRDIVTALHDDGFDDVHVTTVLAPAWSSDWISEDGRRKLREFGIAPPARDATASADGRPPCHGLRRPRPVVACPRCGSSRTVEISRFGSTACKAHYVCRDCHEPFDYFKDI